MVACCANNPGHLGSSLGAVEIAVALHYVFDTPEDQVVWDVGHQAYAHKIITGRRELFKKNRMKGGISGFPRMSESEYDAFGAGHSSTSVSAALGLATAAGLEGVSRKVIAVIGDGALTGGMAFEGLNDAGSRNTDLLVILNDNHISIDPTQGALSRHLLKITTSSTYNRLKNKVWHAITSPGIRRAIQQFVFSTKMALIRREHRGSLFESLGFRYFGPIDGNDIALMVEALGSLKNIHGPKLLHVITQKGKGYAPAECSQGGWHAPGTFDLKTGRFTGISRDDASKYQDVAGETLIELARRDCRIVAVSPAMISGSGLSKMYAEMPDRTFDVGIAEQHAVTFSAGMAAGGLLPYCCIYSTFMQRSFDSLLHDVALQNLKVIFCLDRSGLVGEDGATHHGVFDLSYTRLIPGIAIAAPSDEKELRDLLHSASLDTYPTTIIRYPRGYGEGSSWRGEPFSEIPFGKAVRLREGKGITVLALGTVRAAAEEAVIRASESASAAGKSIGLWNVLFLKPLDEEMMKEAVASSDTLITVEDGTLKGGLYSAVCEYVASSGSNVKVKGLGIPDRFIGQGTVNELKEECGIDSESIYRGIIGNF